MKYIIALLFIPCSIAYANSVDVIIHHSSPASKVIGFIISDTETIEKTNIKIKALNSTTLIASIPVDSTEITPNTTATAMAVLDDGTIRFSDVVPVKNKKKNWSYLSLPICKEKNNSNAVEDQNISSNIGNLESLREVRMIRRDFLAVEVKKIMNPKLLKKLLSIEKGFGLDHKANISPNLNPYELSKKLIHILAALKNFKSHTHNK